MQRVFQIHVKLAIKAVKYMAWECTSIDPLLSTQMGYEFPLLPVI